MLEFVGAAPTHLSNMGINRVRALVSEALVISTIAISIIIHNGIARGAREVPTADGRVEAGAVPGEEGVGREWVVCVGCVCVSTEPSANGKIFE